MLLGVAAFPQEGSFPLELVNVKGSVLTPTTVEEIAGLRLGAPIDKAAMESACKRLADSGLFASIGYEYAPGPKRGYILTLDLSDQPATVPAVIDIPGANEDDVWHWLGEKYPNFVRHIPQPTSAEDFLAHQIEKNLASVLEGQHVVARLEADLKTRRETVVFQPETLPQIASLTFTGVEEFHSDDLAAMLRKTMGTDGFTDRHFKLYLEGVIRQAYEEQGMYRVSFGKISTQKVGPLSLAVTTEISEGQKFTLGEVRLIGDNLPRDAMMKAAAFDLGKTANWRDIQQKIFALEKPVKRTGYFDATARPERILRDEQRQLDLQILFALGPLYHFGEVAFVGLPSGAEADAHKLWKMQTGDPYDYGYANDFLREFSQKVDLRTYKIQFQPQKTGDHVMNETISFTPK
jgi:outer membrane protein assembly factor BamA